MPPSATPKPTSRPGHLAIPLLAAMALLAVGSALFPWWHGFGTARVASLAATTAATANLTTHDAHDSAGAWLARVGLDPRSLAAAGVAANQVAPLFTDARAHLADNLANLDNADASAATLQALVTALEQRVVAGLSSEQDRADLATARADLANANAARASARDGFFAAAAAHLSPAQVAALQMLAANHAREVPLPYRTTQRSPAQWRALRDDLANLRVAQRLGQDPSPASAARVATADAEPNTAASASSLANSLTALASNWSAQAQGQ